jgi:hypothetical protein
VHVCDAIGWWAVGDGWRRVGVMNVAALGLAVAISWLPWLTPGLYGVRPMMG